MTNIEVLEREEVGAGFSLSPRFKIKKWYTLKGVPTIWITLNFLNVNKKNRLESLYYSRYPPIFKLAHINKTHISNGGR
jgi:hypothetical protein